MKHISVLFWLVPTLMYATDPPKTPPPHTSYVEEIGTSGVKFTMVAIKGGTFRIGSPETENPRDFDEGPQRQITLKPFWMGQHEVTWQEFRQFYREVPAEGKKPLKTPREQLADAVSKPTTSYIDETHGFGDFGYPAFNMTHHSAMKYCEWLSQVTGKAYRLPTEAEWEYACRAGTTTAYSFGDEFNAKADQYCWSYRNSKTDEFLRGAVHPVGRLKPNAWGLHDMHGNVAEWCLDMYSASTYDNYPLDQPLLNPRKLPTASRFGNVVRGGNFANGSLLLRSACRSVSKPKWLSYDPQEPPSSWWLAAPPSEQVWVGFRIVRAVEEYPGLEKIRSKVTPQSK